MKSLLLNRRSILVLRLIMGALFIYAGGTKIGHPQAFADSIATFQLVPPHLMNPLALGLPLFEIITGLMLVSGWRLRPAAFSTLVLTVLFALAIGQALARGLQIDCGCFGSGDPSLLRTWTTLGRDLLLMAGGIVIYASSLRGASESEA